MNRFFLSAGSLWLLTIFLSWSPAHAQLGDIHIEGVWGAIKAPTHQRMLEKVIASFLPYNPVIVEMRGRRGEYTKLLAQQFPQGRIFVFEAELEAFNLLLSDIEPWSNVSANPYAFYDGCCESNGIQQIDLIRLDAEDSKFQILKSISSFTKISTVVSLRTDLFSSKNDNACLLYLKYSLESLGFKLLVQWIREGIEGEMIFVRKEVYDSLFN